MAAFTVLHVISSLGTGGAEKMLVRLLPRLAPHGIRSVVVALGGDQTLQRELREQGVQVFDLGMTPGRLPTPAVIARLRRAVAGIRADVIHGWMYHGNLAASLARLFVTGSPAVIWAIHQTVYDLGREKQLTRAVIRACAALSRAPQAIVYVSNVSRQQHRELGFHDARAVDIANGIDVAEYVGGAAARAAARAQLGVPHDCRLVGHVARLHPMKDHTTLLAAAEILLARLGDCRFAVAGEGLSDSNPAFAELARRARADGRFLALGPRSDIARLMPAFDALCLSSAWGEAFPVVLLEAMSSGVLCAATDVGDCARIIGDTGATVAPRDPAALAAALEQLLAIDPAARAERGARARARIADNFSIDAVARAYARLYADVAPAGAHAVA